MGNVPRTPNVSILSVGHPLIDVHANVPEKLFTKYNVELNGATLKGPDQNGLYEELQDKYDVSLVPGGAAQNTMRMMQWISKAKKPIKCSYLGCVGDDRVADFLRQNMRETGVRTHYEVSRSLGTGMCIVLVNGSNRSLVTSLEAAAVFSSKFLKERVSRRMVKEAQVFYIIGYFVGTSMDSIKLLLQHVASYRKLLCFNLASPYVVRLHTEKIDTVMPHADFLFGTTEEAIAYAEAKNLEDTSLEGVAKFLASIPRARGVQRHRLVVLTQGPGNIIAVSSKDGNVQSFSVAPIPDEKIIDTNGAGDAFAAGFLVSYLTEGCLERAVEEGIKAARYIIKQSGFSLGSRDDYE